MNEIIIKAEGYLLRADQGFYTELGEGDAVLREMLAKVKGFFSQDEKPLPSVEVPIPSAEAEQSQEEGGVDTAAPQPPQETPSPEPQSEPSQEDQPQQ